jgi:hypothetical protein
MVHQIEHGYHVFCAYFKNAVLRQYERFSVLLRNELCSNNLASVGVATVEAGYHDVLFDDVAAMSLLAPARREHRGRSRQPLVE